MALPIPEFAVRTFETRWGHVVQQEESKLRSRVTVDSFPGKEKVYKDLSKLVWTERKNRLTDSTPQEVEGFKRKLSKRDFKCQVIFDRKDKDYIVSELSTPGSDTEQAMRMAWNRQVDEMTALGVSAVVYGGADPYVTPITVPGSRQIAVNVVKPGDTPANSGLNPWKLIATRKAFQLSDVEISGAGAEEVYLAISPQQEQDLYQYIAASGNDVWAKMIETWITDQTKKLFGFNVIVSNRLQLNAGTDVRTCVAWTKRGMMIVPEAMQIKVDELPEKDHAIQLAAYADYGVMRRYEEHVAEIYCDESP